MRGKKYISFIKPLKCPNCDIWMGVQDIIGMPKNGLVYVCKECGEVFCNDLAAEYMAGRFEGLGEFWMKGVEKHG